MTLTAPFRLSNSYVFSLISANFWVKEIWKHLRPRYLQIIVVKLKNTEFMHWDEWACCIFLHDNTLLKTAMKHLVFTSSWWKNEATRNRTFHLKNRAVFYNEITFMHSIQTFIEDAEHCVDSFVHYSLKPEANSKLPQSGQISLVQILGF